MKKFFLLLAVAFAAFAAQAEVLTVNDDAVTNEYSPIYGYYYDTQNYIVQTIMPEADLTAMKGGFITAMKFYVAGENGNLLNGGKLAVSLGTTNQTSFTNYSSPVEVTKVAEITMTLGETEVAGGIDFHPDAVFGDVNGDKEVNISDVNAVIAVILTSADFPLADVNGDGEVNISDINTLISVILY